MQPVALPQIPDFINQVQQVISYREIQEVLHSPDFLQSGAAERRIFFEDTLIYAEGERHSELKQQFRSLMSREAMTYYELNLLGPVIAKVIDVLKNHRSSNGVVRTELVGLIRIMLHQISAGVTGVDFVDSDQRTERFAQLIAKIGEAVTSQWTRRERENVVAEGRLTLASLVEEFLQPSLDRRLLLAERFKRNEISQEQLPRDVVMTMCLADDIYKPDDATRIPYVWRQCCLFLAASIQTTSHTLPHVIVHLDEWLLEHPEDRQHLTDPQFLRKAATESLRLHQSSAVKFRVAAKDVVLSTGRRVAAGEQVALFTTQANRAEAVFGEDAAYFNPYRKTPTAMMPWGLTFGSGRHMCFGSNLVIGVAGKPDSRRGTEGTMVNILRTLYELGCELDPQNPPRRTTISFHDAYETVPILLSKL